LGFERFSSRLICKNYPTTTNNCKTRVAVVLLSAWQRQNAIGVILPRPRW
jgi:hypothetical protein